MSTATLHNEKIKTLVPKLRFQEFDGEWQQKKLGDVCEKIQDGNYGGEYPKAEEFVEKGVPFLTSKALGGDGFIKEDKLDFIPLEKHLKLKKAQLKLNDVLFTNRGSNVGSIGYTDLRIAHGNIGPQLTLLRSNLKVITPFFLYQIMKSDTTIKQIRSQDSGSAMNFFGIGSTSKFNLSIPTLPEQQKIASFLSAVDVKIQQLTRKATLLEQYKKGVMQQLFSGKLRFKDSNRKDYPDWEDKKLGEVFSFKQGVQCGVEDQFLEKTENLERFIRIIDLTSNTEVPRYINILDKNNILYEDDLFMVRYGVPGLVGYGYTGIIANNLFRLIPKNIMHNKFYYYVLTYLNKDIMNLSSSTTMPALNFGSLGILKIPSIDIKEQQKIANFLSSIDSKIEMVNQQLAKTQTFKKGLLQQMFV